MSNKFVKNLEDTKPKKAAKRAAQPYLLKDSRHKRNTSWCQTFLCHMAPPANKEGNHKINTLHICGPNPKPICI